MHRTAQGVLALATLLVVPTAGYAQAWLPPKGEGTLAVAFQRVNANGHFLEDGSELPGYATRASNGVFVLSYGITDRLAATLTAPFVNVRYLGPDEPLNLPDNVLDDGGYHGALTDLRLELRYGLLQRSLAVAPFVAAVVPSHDYDTLGEAAAGRGFQELHLGAQAGRLLDPVLPRGFLHASYAYAFVRQDLDIPLNYSTLNAEAGYFVTPSLPVSFMWRRLWNHGGLSFNELFVAPPEVFVNLDRVVRASHEHVGIAVSIPLGESVSIHGDYLWFVSGKDAHYGSGFSFGVSWRFREAPSLFPGFPID
jgi:hypothetical protein